ncbi:integrin alpha-PS3-like isoform X1 [Palaemon carinicauda]|uniref:integrin alpha-PS3-like isoform X1 n=1 Tax=Palaemon carinicauda TaxID=392227 RepID=UPI0035B60493
MEPNRDWGSRFHGSSYQNQRIYGSRYLLSHLLLLSQWWWSFTVAFNLEPESYKVFEDPLVFEFSWGRETYFGFSVSLQKNFMDGSAWLLVGAPRANSSYYPDPRDVMEPGAIFKCNVQNSSCEELWIDQNGSDCPKDTGFCYKDMKNNGWLGASIDTQQAYDGGRQASGVCAPRWINQYFGKYYMNGACYWMNASLPNAPAHKKLPLAHHDDIARTIKGEKYFYFAYGQAGMSLHLADDPSEMVIGAPGVFNWRGSVIRLKDTKNEPSQPTDDIEESQMFLHKDVFNPYYTKEIDSFSLNGYSVTSGYFLGKGERLYASGAPRSAASLGNVFIFNFPKPGSEAKPGSEPLDVRQVLSGKQVGENFGAALVSADFNGDGLTDLVVGCPVYFRGSNPGIGRIEVFLGSQTRVMESAGSRGGSNLPSSHFGTTLAALGDLNRDSFEDVAIGAPWENDGSGAVYIYLGAEDGLREQFSQRISPKDFPTREPLRGFGMGISRGTDIDDDGYPDLAIGSFLSSHAVILKSRTVALLNGSLSSSPSALPEDATELELTACITFDGYRVPQTAEIQGYIEIDEKQRFSRATFKDTGSAVRNITISHNRSQGKTSCLAFEVDVEIQKLDPMRPLSIRMDYWLLNTPGEKMSLARTDPEADRSARLVVGVETDCDADGNATCVTNMTVRASFVNYRDGQKYPIGSKESPVIEITVENSAESVFLPNVTVTVVKPFALFMPSTHRCEFPDRAKRLSLVCQLKNPIKKGEKDVLQVTIDTDKVKDTAPSELEVHMKAAGDGTELEPADDVISQRLPLMAKAELELRGYSIEEQVFYRRIGEDKINKTKSKSSFIQQYSLIKTGPTPIDDVELIVDIPISINEEKLITLFSPEMEAQDWKCQDVSNGAFQNGRNNNGFMRSIDTSNSVNGTDSSTRLGTGLRVGDGEKREFACSSDQVTCRTFVCHVYSLPGGSYSAKFSIRMTIDLAVLEKYISPKDGAVVVSSASARIVSLWQDLEFQGIRNVTGQAKTDVLPDSMSKKGVPWWVIFLTVIISLILLAIIIFVLYKRGFFVRKKRETMMAHRAHVVASVYDDTPNE